MKLLNEPMDGMPLRLNLERRGERSEVDPSLLVSWVKLLGQD